MAYGKSFSYNFETISAKDLVQFVQEIGMEVEKFSEQNKSSVGFNILGVPMKINIPNPPYIQSVNFHVAVSKHGDVFWDSTDKRYQDNPQLKKEHEKIFNKLKRKFQMKKGEHPKSIKDLDWINKEFDLKPKPNWWPFN